MVDDTSYEETSNKILGIDLFIKTGTEVYCTYFMLIKHCIHNNCVVFMIKKKKGYLIFCIYFSTV